MEEIITVEKLTKTYGPKNAVNNLNLSVKRRSAFALLGENGAGKSTAIECILGTKKADSGKVSVLGYNPALIPFRCQLFSFPEYIQSLYSFLRRSHRAGQMQIYVLQTDSNCSPHFLVRMFLSVSQP